MGLLPDLRTPLSGELGLTEPTNDLAVIGPQSGANRETRAVAVAHHDENRFSNVYAYLLSATSGRPILMLHVACNGDVQIPHSVPFKQPTLTLSASATYTASSRSRRLGECGCPKAVILLVRDFEVLLDRVVWHVVESQILVGESHRIIGVKPVGVVAVSTGLWDVPLEGVFTIANQIILDNYVRPMANLMK